MARPSPSLLIRQAELWSAGSSGQRADVLIEHGKIARIGRDLIDLGADRVIDAKGGLLLPGLHDHHIHLAGLAVRRQSVWCGPPQVCDRAQLAESLARPSGTGWIRAIGYHESVLDGLPDAATLDRLVPDRPLRMQHRSGRMWLLNSAALALLLASGAPPPGMERENGRYTGRLFDADQWLRSALGSVPPDFAEISRDLAALGVTGLTDMTPQNGPGMAAHFATQRRSEALTQSVVLAGVHDLADAPQEGWALGPVKLHLHEADLPAFDGAVAMVRAGHDQGRAVAIHCVSEVELVFALALLEESGAIPGDRIEHASITSLAQALQVACNGVAICVQPHFIAERGDRYLLDVEPRLHGDLYRLASLQEAGIALAGGSDAPFAGADPWSAMRAAVSRKTNSGQIINDSEALTAEQAVSLWLADPHDLSHQREVAEGAPADLCLLDRPWAEAKNRLSGNDLVLTLASGQIIHDCIDQAPFERHLR